MTAVAKGVMNPEKSRVLTQSLGYRDDLIARGYGFYSTWEHSDEVGGTPVPAGGKLYAEFTSPPDKYFALSFREVVTNKERVFYRVYTNYGAATIGDSIRIGKLRADSSVDTGSTFNKVTNQPNLTNALKVTNIAVFGSVNSGNRASGSLYNDSVFRLIPPNVSFLLELDNQSAENAYVSTELIWAEIPEQLIVDNGLS